MISKYMSAGCGAVAVAFSIPAKCGLLSMHGHLTYEKCTGQCFVQLEKSSKTKVYAATEEMKDDDSDSNDEGNQNNVSARTDVGSTNNPSDDRIASVSSSESITKDMEDTLTNIKKVSSKLRSRIMARTTVLGILLNASCIFMATLARNNPGQYGTPAIYSGMATPTWCLILLGLMPNDILTIRLIAFVFWCFYVIVFLISLASFVNLWFFQRHEHTDFDGISSEEQCGSDLPLAGCAVHAFSHLPWFFEHFWVVWYAWQPLAKVPGVRFYDRKQRKGFSIDSTKYGFLSRSVDLFVVCARFNESAFKISSRVALNRIWFLSRFQMFGIVLIDGTHAVVCHALGDLAPFWTDADFSGAMFKILVAGLTAVFFSTDRRQQIMSFLSSTALDLNITFLHTASSLDTADEAQSAASVAALVGGISPKDAIALAKSKFRSIPFSALSEEDFNSNRGEKGQENKLFEHTKEEKIGCCDVFMSHSWKDDGPKKFEALQDFAEEFKAEHGRYPNIWLDKACIDQTDIENDLKCLPIFLAGCKTLLVMPGPTYTSRLWCVMEIFTFLKMGGSPDRIKVVPLNMTNEEAKAKFYSIDVRKCQCYVEQDKQRLLGIIQSGFGSFTDFNKLVQHVFKQRMGELQIISVEERLSSRRPSVTDDKIENIQLA